MPNTNTSVNPPDTSCIPNGIDPSVIASAKIAQRVWAGANVRKRLTFVHQLRYLLVEMENEFCQAVKEDIDKPKFEALSNELIPLADALKFTERRASSLLAPRSPSFRDRPVWLFGNKERVHRIPRGVVGIIGTWNYPIMLNGIQIVQALVAGNAVVWKPSEVAPKTAEVMKRWLESASLPQSLVQVLPAAREYGPMMAEIDVDHIVFTGHDTTGRRLAARLGERLVSSTLELSGHDAMLVMPDADIYLAVCAAWFGLNINAGQTCIANRRLFVPRRLVNEFQEKLKQRMADAPPPLRKLAQSSAVAHVDELIRKAESQGAKLLVNRGSDTQEKFDPVVLTEVKPEMEIARTACFAPVMSILPYDDPKKLIPAVEQCGYCLALSLFSQYPKHWLMELGALPAGMVTINDVIAGTAHPAVPFGGIRSSGWGSTQGAEGLLEMTVPQLVSTRAGKWRPHYDPPGKGPFTDEKVLLGMLRWRHSKGFSARFGSFWRMIRAMWR